MLQRLDSLERAPRPPENSNTPSGPTTPVEGFHSAHASPPNSRDPYSADPTVLRALATAAVPREAIRPVLAPFFAEAGLGEADFEVRGPLLSERHTACITGDAVTARSRAEKVLAALKRADGT